MGVYINGMKMPKGCATCPYCDRTWNKPKCKAKSVQGRFMEQKLNLDRTRQKWCPLVYILPHGDLIDRNETIKALWKALYEYEDRTEKQFVESSELDVADWILYRIFVQDMSDIDRQTILQMPTIIPADVPDNNVGNITAEEGES